MERGNNKKLPTCLLTSDWHLREDQPICRIDSYWDAQWKKVDFISNLQKKYNCPVIHGGDLFDHWKPSPNLLRQTIEHIPDKFYSIYGQHDLPAHQLDLVDKCGMNVLEAAKKLIILKPNRYYTDNLTIDGIHWGQKPEQIKQSNLGRRMLVWHVMNYQGKLPWPDCPAPLAAGLLRKYLHDIILTGDNHKPFTEEFEGRWLVNPGSLMRMDADQINHRPRVYLWYAETNEIQVVYIPIVEDVISREHIDIKKDRDSRIEAFISKLDNNWKAKMSFEENLEEFSKLNGIREPVINIIYKSLE